MVLERRIAAVRERQRKEREEAERRKREEEEERKKKEAADKMRREELERARTTEAKRKAAEIARQQGSGRKRSLSVEMEAERAECARCRRMAVVCTWPSGGRATACNACAAAKQRCGGGEAEGPERKRPRPTKSRRLVESEEEIREVREVRAAERPIGAEVGAAFYAVATQLRYLVTEMTGWRAEVAEWRKEMREERESRAERKTEKMVVDGSETEKVAEVEAEKGKEKAKAAEVEAEAEAVVAAENAGPGGSEEILQVSPGSPAPSA